MTPASLLFLQLPLALGVATWLEPGYDFGLFREQGGPKTGSVRFVNTGDSPLEVIEVKPSCGCTVAGGPEDPVAPGDTAAIWFTYDPAMRPGKFEKHVRVRFADNTRTSIPIKGNVLGTPSSLATLFPVEAGDLRLSEPAVPLGEVVMGRTPTAFVNAYSMPLDSVTPTVVSGSPALRTEASAPASGPGDIVTWSLSLDTRRLGLYGPVEIPVDFQTPSGSACIAVTATVVPDGDALARSQGDRHPVCNLSPDPMDFGAAEGNAPLTATLTVANDGNAPLNILAVYPAPTAGAPRDAVSTGSLPKRIKPHKSAPVSVTLRPGRLSPGPHRIPLAVVTDDPHTPVLTADAVCFVTKPE